MVSASPPASLPPPETAATSAPPVSAVPAAPAAADRAEAASSLDGRQIFFLFVGSALAACLIFALGVTVGRRIEQRAAAREKTTPADPLAMLDEIANAEEALTFHRAVLERPNAERPAAGAQAAPAATPAAVAGARSRYTLNSAAFAQRPAAEEQLRRLRDAGYKVKVLEGLTLEKRQTYRLQLGEFATAEAAQPLRGELLQRFGLATTVVKLVRPDQAQAE